jgi:lipopolysaccharide biosynthesis regulator YciM
MKFFFWVITLILSIVAAVVFSDLNPEHITLRFPANSSTTVTPTTLVLACVIIGALAVTMLVWLREIRALILNWRSSRRRKREERIEAYYADGVLASLSRRTTEAISLLQKLLALEPDHIRALVLLGNILRREKHYNEAIRLHRKARQLDEGSLEILFTLAKDLQEAKRYEEAIQTVGEVLKIDATNPTALYRLRDMHMHAGRWTEAHSAQERLLKAGLPEREIKTETQIMTGLKYEVGRSFLERGDRDQARRFFKDAIKLDKGFLPARIGFGETLIHEGKTRQAAESWEKSYIKTCNPIFLQRLEDLYLKMGEPGEMIRIYQDALARTHMDPTIKLALGRLYYRLEMIDDAFELLSTLEGLFDPAGGIHKMMASLYIRKGNTEAALLEIQEGLGSYRPGWITFQCTACLYQTQEWNGRCLGCGSWNTIAIKPPVGIADASLESTHITGTASVASLRTPFEIV